MTNWKSPADYQFTKSLDSYGWAWEFMRRNRAYRIDYKKVSKSKPLSFLMSGAQVHLAEKWGIEPPLSNPKGPRRPRFAQGYPTSPSYADLARHFTSEGEVPFPTRFAVLVFDLAASLEPQLTRARTVLKPRKRKDSEPEKAPYVAKKNWTNFLRLLDAEEAGASGPEIRQFIDSYKSKSKELEDIAKAANKLWRHRKLARQLRDHPLRILRP
jgi:hypothetical protein